MPERRLSLLTGYSNGTYPPPRAYDAGLRTRFAAVLDTSRPAAEGMFLDIERFLHLVDALIEAVPHDQVLFELGDERPAVPPDADGPAAALQPPEQIILARNARVVSVVETECRVNVGAASFHDVYTVVLYTQEDRSASLRRACERAAAAADLTFAGDARGAAHREPFVPFWKRPLRWVGCKVW